MKKAMQFIVPVGIVMLVAIIGIGYATFTTSLTIAGMSNAHVQGSSWSILFSDLQNVELNGTAVENTAPTLTDVTNLADFDVTFTTPGDSATYKFKVRNNGTFDAKLTSISIPSTFTCTGTGANATSDAQKVCGHMSYTLTDSTGGALAVNETLAAGDAKDLVLTITYEDFNDANDLPTNAVTVSGFGITLLYGQA